MTIASMQTRNTALSSEVDSLNTQKTALQTELNSATASVESFTVSEATLRADLAKCKDEDSDSISDALAIVIYIIVSAMFLIVSLTLVVIICKERKGYPVFAPVAGTPVGNATYGSSSADDSKI